MKKIALLFTLLSGACAAIAQRYEIPWNLNATAPKEKPVLQPVAYRNIGVNEGDLSFILSTITDNANAPATIMLPVPDGSLRAFNIWQTPVMEAALADKYPEIRTYTAAAVDNHFATAKIDYTPFGFHAMIADGANSFFIDPFGKAADGRYISYYRRDYRAIPGNSVVCAVDNKHFNTPTVDPTGGHGGNSVGSFRLNGAIHRTYRLALACTGEYAVAVAGPNPTKPAVLAKMVTTLNRVNSVYERDFAITMQLVGNDDTLIFLDGANDPYSDNSAGAMLSQNQSTIDARIKTANYDIGHVFGTGGGGAGTGLGLANHGVCQASSKALGVTGTPTPTGDAFDIDYVAHEMGHQYGAEHTYNAATNGPCNFRSAIQEFAYEPGSGSTIMAYAGICGSDDIQPHTDPYFHSTSLEEITTYINTNTCAMVSLTGTSMLRCHPTPRLITYLISLLLSLPPRRPLMQLPIPLPIAGSSAILVISARLFRRHISGGPCSALSGLLPTVRGFSRLSTAC